MPKELTPADIKNKEYQKTMLRYFKVFRSDEQNAELKRRLDDDLPLQGIHDYQSMFNWKPGVARPYRDGEMIIWQK